MDDVRLAALAAGGDERAFEALYDRHHRALLGFCRHMLGSPEEAEDALQQTFLRAHRALVSRGSPDEVRPWLYTIARNRCLSMLSARRPEAVPAEDAEPAVDGLGAAVEQRADLRALLGDIAQLPEDQRSALVLSELADLSHEEIAGVIDVPKAKVKALVHQARSRLMAEREARELPCEQVRERLSTARGGELRRGPLRRHLAVCEPCRDYRDAVREQRVALGLVLPVVPSAGLKEAILGMFGGGGGGAVAALTGGSGLGAKVAIGVVVAGGASGGAVAVKQAEQPPQRSAAAVAAKTAAPAARTPAPVATFVAAEATPVATVRAVPRKPHRAAKVRGPERRAQTPAGPKVAPEKPSKAERRVTKEQAKSERVAVREQRKAAKVKPAKPPKPVKPVKVKRVKPVKVKAPKPKSKPHPTPAATPETVAALPPGQAKKQQVEP